MTVSASELSAAIVKSAHAQRALWDARRRASAGAKGFRVPNFNAIADEWEADATARRELMELARGTVQPKALADLVTAIVKANCVVNPDRLYRTCLRMGAVDALVRACADCGRAQCDPLCPGFDNPFDGGAETRSYEALVDERAQADAERYYEALADQAGTHVSDLLISPYEFGADGTVYRWI